MRLIECYIENFGMLSGYSYKFDKGLNCILGDNGTGKTTLSFFIKAMFYGIGDTKARDLDENDRKKYLPWQGGTAGGSLTFEWGGKVYRVERTFGARPSEDTVRVVEPESGALVASLTDNLGEKVFGIDREGFERTVFLSEKNLTGKITNATIAAKLSDLVGSDGATDSFDVAKKKLEERRKFYYKKGNTGGIADIEAKIRECEDTLSYLEGRRAASVGYEATMSEAARAIDALIGERRGYEDRLRRERERAALVGQRQQYIGMVASLEVEKKSLEGYDTFFKAGLPTAAEIDEAKDAWREASSLSEAIMSSEAGELTELGGFFARPTDFSEIARIEDGIKRCEDIAAERGALAGKVRLGKDALTAELGGRIPTVDEVDRHIAAMGKGASPLSVLLAVLGGIIALSGVVLGVMLSQLFFIAAAVGAVLSALGIVRALGGKEKGAREAAKYASRLGISGGAAGLTALRDRLAQHYATLADDEARLSGYDAEAARLSGETVTFLGAYAHGKDNEGEAIRLIKARYERYYALSLKENEARAENKEREVRRAYLSEKARTFLAKYPTTSPDPFEEIREKLQRRTLSAMAVERQARECEQFRAANNIELTADMESEAVGILTLEELLRENEEKISRERQKYTLAEREWNECQADVERIDDVGASLAEYKRKLAEYKDNFEVIKMTLALLTEACERMTERYIGGARTRFKEYEEMMGGDGGDYSIDTSFVIKKHDRGESRAAESYSRGTKDLHALALRLALVDSLYDGDCPFILLDDPFISFDDKRLSGAKALLHAIAEKKQVIYFTCSRERAI